MDWTKTLILAAALGAAAVGPGRAQDAGEDELAPAGPVELRRHDLGFAAIHSHPEAPELCLAASLLGDATYAAIECGEDEAPVEELMVLLQDLLVAEGWEGSLELEHDGRTARVTADAAGQRRVAELLDDLTAQLGAQTRVTLRVLACAELPPGLRDQPAGRALAPAAAAALEAGLARGGVTLVQELRCAARDARPTHVSSLDEGSFLGDLEVNQTGVIPVLNPVLVPLRAGSAADLVATTRADGAVQLDVRLQMNLPHDEVARLELPGRCTLFQPTATHLRLGASAVLSPGRPALLGVVRSTRAGPLPGAGETPGAPLLLVVAEVEPEAPRPAPPARADRHRVRFVPHAALRGQGPDLTFPDPPGPPSSPTHQGGVLVFEDGEGAGDYDPQTLVDDLRRLLEGSGWQGWDDLASDVEVTTEHLRLVALPADMAMVERALAALQASAPPPLGFEVHLLRVPAGAVPAASPLDAAARAALLGAGRVEERLAVPALGGRTVQLDLFRERPYLGGYERSSGGTGEVVEVVDDPLVGVLAGGARVRLSGEPLGDGVAVTADVLVQSLGQLELVQTGWGPVQTVSGRQRLAATRRVTVPKGGAAVLQVTAAGPERWVLLVSASRLD